MLKGLTTARVVCNLLALIYLAITPSGFAKGVPEWVSTSSRAALPEEALESDAVCLLNETRTVVTEQGETRSFLRRAYKVLAPEGRNVSVFPVAFDDETKVFNLKGWNLKPDGSVHPVSIKDAVETQMASSVLFEDTRHLVLQIPQVVVGSVIALELERKHRPRVFQDFSTFETIYPTLLCRYLLELPPGWGFRYRMLHHSDVPPQQTLKNCWTWELRDLQGIEEEELMPPVESLAAALAVAYFPEGDSVKGEDFSTWDNLASWINTLMAARLVPSPEIQAFAKKTTEEGDLERFVQEQIRYVAIEIGIGGHQPHPAADTFKARYGDCKDKVTLLRSLHRAAGRDLYPVLISASGTDPDPDFPSPFYFDHMIAAIPVQDDQPGPAVLDHPSLGGLLLFDPTDPQTPLGKLPHHLQGRKALLVNGVRGELVETPVAPALYNRLIRQGQFNLLKNGQLEGKVQELFRGATANHEQGQLRSTTKSGWVRMNEAFLARWLPGVILTKIGVGDLDQSDSFSEAYDFLAPFFAQPVGEEAVLVRPCVLGSKVYRLPFRSKREHPLQFDYLRVHTDSFDISLPTGAIVETLPEPVDLEFPFAHYKSEVTAEDNHLKYSRSLEIKQLQLSAETVALLREFYQVVDRDEKSVVVLRLAKAEEDDQSRHR